MESITVEKLSRVLNGFNIGFSEGTVLSYLKRGFLEYAPRPESGYYSRNTKYGYTVSRDSCVKLLKERGLTQEEINATLLN